MVSGIPCPPYAGSQFNVGHSPSQIYLKACLNPDGVKTLPASRRHPSISPGTLLGKIISEASFPASLSIGSTTSSLYSEKISGFTFLI